VNGILDGIAEARGTVSVRRWDRSVAVVLSRVVPEVDEPGETDLSESP